MYSLSVEAQKLSKLLEVKNIRSISGVAVKASGEVVKDYEMDSECLKNGVNTFEEYVAYKKQKLEEFFGHDVNCEIKSEDYTFRISFDFAKHYVRGSICVLILEQNS